MHCFSSPGQDGHCRVLSAGSGHHLGPRVLTCRESGCKPSQVPLGGTVIRHFTSVSFLEMVAWICISFRFFSCTRQKLTSGSALWIFMLQHESGSKNFDKKAKCDQACAKKTPKHSGTAFLSQGAGYVRYIDLIWVTAVLEDGAAARFLR